MKELLNFFPEEKRKAWEKVLTEIPGLQEIRLRGGMPIMLSTRDGEFFMSASGNPVSGRRLAETVTDRELEEFLQRVCRYSPYAYETELGQGFLTVPGGHRIGVAGQVVLGTDGRVRTIKYIHSLNIRISHEIKGAANEIISCIREDRTNRIKNTLIISPPGGGKTTLLRDIIRQLSDGSDVEEGVTVGVVDERSELAGVYMGIPQLDLGIRTDIMDGCPKSQGIMMLVRSMSPKVIAVDELGGAEDFRAIRQAMTYGCSVIATVHGKDLGDVFRKGIIGIRQGDSTYLFDLYVIMGRVGGIPVVSGIYEKEGMDASLLGRFADHRGNAGSGNLAQKPAFLAD